MIDQVVLGTDPEVVVEVTLSNIKTVALKNPTVAKFSAAAYRHQKGRCPKGHHFEPEVKRCQKTYAHGGLYKRIYLSKKARKAGEARGKDYWRRRNRRADRALTLATEILPGGTAINIGRRVAPHVVKGTARQLKRSARRSPVAKGFRKYLMGRRQRRRRARRG
jgi:hypothetical protein